ncbi:MAG TPA: helix-turn-helix domain-containing protein [Solirubrobacteraceae bacterium]|nr:helix-turn-helix domain-containing protein [Solirubrobacteraceae bacterium]
MEDVKIGIEDEIVVVVRPVWRERDRCGVCRRRCAGFDLGEGRRRWRALDLGTTLAFVEADAPRVRCRRHGVVVCAVSWARHRSRFTRAFEDQAAWLAVNTSKSAVAELMRVAWRTVGAICERVADEAQRQTDLLDGLRRIGIDEISHRKSQRYLTVIVDHDTGRLVWAAAGRDRRTVEAFFDALGEMRCKQIKPDGQRRSLVADADGVVSATLTGAKEITVSTPAATSTIAMPVAPPQPPPVA